MRIGGRIDTMASGAAPDIWLGHLRHLDRRHHARRLAHLLQGILQGEGVDDGRQHHHVVGVGPVHALARRNDCCGVIAAHFRILIEFLVLHRFAPSRRQHKQDDRRHSNQIALKVVVGP